MPCLSAQKKVSRLKWGKPSNVGHVHRHAGTGVEWELLSESWKWRKTDLGGGIMSRSQCQHSESTALVFKCQKGSRSSGPHIWISLKREVYKIKCFVSDGCVTSAQTLWGSEWTDSSQRHGASYCILELAWHFFFFKLSILKQHSRLYSLHITSLLILQCGGRYIMRYHS